MLLSLSAVVLYMCVPVCICKTLYLDFSPVKTLELYSVL